MNFESNKNRDNKKKNQIKSKFNMNQEIYNCLQQNKKFYEDANSKKINSLEELKKKPAFNNTNFSSNTDLNNIKNSGSQMQDQLKILKNDVESDYNNNNIFHSDKKQNIIFNNYQYNIYPNTAEKNQHYENNIPKGFYFSDTEKINNEKDIKEFNRFYHSLCKLIGRLTNFNFNIIENSTEIFLCELKFFSMTKNEKFIQFQVKFYKSIEIDYFDYIPISNIIDKNSIFNEELEILKEDFKKFMEKILDFIKIN